MTTDEQPRPTIVLPGTGKLLADRESSVILGGEQTAGRFATMLGNIPPGGGPPYHVHARDDELFIVADGTLSFFTTGSWIDVGPGGVAYFPRGVPHRFHNRSLTPARRWVLTTPAGFEQFFARSTAAVARPGGPDGARLAALEAEYGYTVLAEPTAGASEEAEAGEKATIVRSDARRVLDIEPGREISVILAGEQTGGRFALVAELIPPDAGTPPHFHTHEDKLFLVTAGRISYCIDGTWTDVGPGGAVYVPRGTPHSFRNRGTVPASQWIVIAPAGFERFFARLAEEASRPGGPDGARLAALNGVFGMILVGEQRSRQPTTREHDLVE